MRAFSDNEDLALLSGIDPDKIVRVTWILAAALATIAGVLYGLDKKLQTFHLFSAVVANFLGCNRWRNWATDWRNCWRVCRGIFRSDNYLCLQEILDLYGARRLGACRVGAVAVNGL